MERTCKKCNQLKPLEKFYKQKGCKEGRGYMCYTCMNNRECFIIGRRRYEESEKCKTTVRRKNERKKESNRLKSTEYRRKYPERIKKVYKKRSENITDTHLIKNISERIGIGMGSVRLIPNLSEYLNAERELLKLKRAIKKLK